MKNMQIKNLLLILIFMSMQLFGSDDSKTVFGVNSDRAKQGAVFFGVCAVLAYIGNNACKVNQEEMALHDRDDQDLAVSQGVAPALPKTKTGIFGFFERFMTRFMGCDELIADIKRVDGQRSAEEEKELADQASRSQEEESKIKKEKDLEVEVGLLVDSGQRLTDDDFF